MQLLSIELLGISKEGVQDKVCVTTQRGYFSTAERVTFAEGVENIVGKGLYSYSVLNFLITVNDDIIYKDVIETESDYNSSVLIKGVDVILNLAETLLNPKHIMVYN